MPHRALQEEERSLWTLFGTFFKIGLFTFGGGYAMIALLENEFITKKHWLGRDEFLDMAAIAESTPGPVAINSATYLGYKLAGVCFWESVFASYRDYLLTRPSGNM